MARCKQTKRTSKRRNRNKRNGGDKGEKSDKGDGYVLVERKSDQFEAYYKEQAVVPSEEFDQFMQALRTPLPSTFRVTSFGRHGKELLKSIQNDYLNNLCNITINETEVPPPKCLEWYPDGLAWQLNTDRNSIRHVPQLENLKQFLITESNAGNISRQEAVSMIPPLVLDVQPQHKVLDMCAAPGSKTAQLIEFLHADENSIIPEGVVVANDSDNKRCYLMCHQVKRLQTPCFMIVNHDASQLPGFVENDTLFKFDRVLADVPCTGDGTLRKNVDAWMKWNPAAAHNLHMLQSRILKRGLQVLKTGGRLVYSTCSLNPIENEAVLSAVLADYPGETEILDVSTELPGLKFLPGKSTWKVMSRNGDWFTQMSEVPERLQTQIFPSMFPPSSEQAEKLHLDRCLRILPHLQDTGGFFVAVIEKKSDGKEKKYKESAVSSSDSESKSTGISDDSAKNTNRNAELETASGPNVVAGSEVKVKKRDVDFDKPLPLKKQKLQGYKEDPFIFLQKDESIMNSIMSFYGLKVDFPIDQILVRNTEGKKRNLYFVSNTVKQIAQSNEDKIKFINMGVKLFSRSESKYCPQCDYRLCQDGIEVVFPYMTERIIHVSRDDLIVLLQMENPFVNQFTQAAQKQMGKLSSSGSIVFVFDPEDAIFEKVEKPQCKLIISGWKGMVSARTFLPVPERAHFLRLCGVEYKSKTQREKEKKEAQPDEENEINSKETDESDEKGEEATSQ